MEDITEQFNKEDIYLDNDTNEVIRNVMDRHDTDKYTFKYKEDWKDENKQNVQYYLKFHDRRHYEVKQKFKENSKLFKYLIHKSPRYQKHIKHYALNDIIRSIIHICMTENLHDPENPRIVICNPHMRNILGIEAFHHIDLIEIILEHIEPNETQDRNYVYTDYETPIYITNNEKYLNSLIDPPWTRLNAKMIRAKHIYNKRKPYRKPYLKYRIDDDLFEVLKKAGRVNDNQQIMKYDNIYRAFLLYVLLQLNTFNNKNTHENIINLRNTPLEILNIDRIHKYQIETILNTKITKHDPPLCDIDA